MWGAQVCVGAEVCVVSVTRGVCGRGKMRVVHGGMCGYHVESEGGACVDAMCGAWGIRGCCVGCMRHKWMPCGMHGACVDAVWDA